MFSEYNNSYVVRFGRAYKIVYLSYYLKESLATVQSVFTERGKKSISHHKKYFPPHHNLQKLTSTSLQPVLLQKPAKMGQSYNFKVRLCDEPCEGIPEERLLMEDICHHPPHSLGGILAFMPVQVVPRIISST